MKKNQKILKEKPKNQYTTINVLKETLSELSAIEDKVGIKRYKIVADAVKLYKEMCRKTGML